MVSSVAIRISDNITEGESAGAAFCQIVPPWVSARVCSVHQDSCRGIRIIAAVFGSLLIVEQHDHWWPRLLSDLPSWSLCEGWRAIYLRHFHCEDA